MSTLPTIDLGTSDRISGQVPVRKLISLVLLLAVRDRATEVRFVPCAADGEWKLGYQVGGEWFAMEPVPLDVPISQEVRRLGRMHAPFWGLFGGRGPNEAAIRVLIAGQPVAVVASLHGVAGQPLETVVLRLPQQAAPSEDAARLLGEFMEGWRAEPDPA
jgi:type IV pilus assembly protein PilB